MLYLHYTEDELKEYIASDGDARVWTGTVQEGEALALPPGFVFTDTIGARGTHGVKLTFAHRASLPRLEIFHGQARLFNKDAAATDEVLKAVVEDPQHTHTYIVCMYVM